MIPLKSGCIMIIYLINIYGLIRHGLHGFIHARKGMSMFMAVLSFTRVVVHFSVFGMRTGTDLSFSRLKVVLLEGTCAFDLFCVIIVSE